LEILPRIYKGKDNFKCFYRHVWSLWTFSFSMKIIYIYAVFYVFLVG
jgi:hypothetical protein